MTNDEKIAALEREVSDLKARVQDLFDALKLECESTTKHFGRFDELLAEVIDYLMPVVHKTFPGIGRGKREIEEFLKRRPPKKD